MLHVKDAGIVWASSKLVQVVKFLGSGRNVGLVSLERFVVAFLCYSGLNAGGLEDVHSAMLAQRRTEGVLVEVVVEDQAAKA